MDILDGTTAFARVEQWIIIGSLAATNTAHSFLCARGARGWQLTTSVGIYAVHCVECGWMSKLVQAQLFDVQFAAIVGQWCCDS
jgi:hypothetical protein